MQGKQGVILLLHQHMVADVNSNVPSGVGKLSVQAYEIRERMAFNGLPTTPAALWIQTHSS